MEIWQFQETITRRLLAWAGLSIGSGVVLTGRGDRFWQGLGAQFVGWGLVDGLIALAGRSAARRSIAALPAVEAPERARAEARSLGRLLWINTFLDVVYILGGQWLARSKGRTDPAWRGHGWGVVVQGGFLFLFDLLHAWQLSKHPQ